MASSDFRLAFNALRYGLNHRAEEALWGGDYGCFRRYLSQLVLGTRQAGCMLFEGFMDFLSYLTAARRGDKYMQVDEPCDYLVMNSVSNLRKSLQYLGQYRHIHCFLDNDLAGRKTCETIASLYENRVSDESFRYADYKDLNDYLLGRKR